MGLIGSSLISLIFHVGFNKSHLLMCKLVQLVGYFDNSEYVNLRTLS